MAFVCGREMAQSVHHEGLFWASAPWENTLPHSYISLRERERKRQREKGREGREKERKDGNVWWHILLLWLHAVGHIRVNDHSAREKTCCCHFIGYSFQFAERDIFLCTIQHIYIYIYTIYTTAFVKPGVEHWLEWKTEDWMRQQEYIYFSGLTPDHSSMCMCTMSHQDWLSINFILYYLMHISTKSHLHELYC